MLLPQKLTGETSGAIDLEEGADAVQRRVGDVLEVWVVEAAQRIENENP